MSEEEWRRAAKILERCLEGRVESDFGGFTLHQDSWKPIADAISAAEQRGRERGIEEAARLVGEDASYQERGDPRERALLTAASRIRALLASAA